MTTSANARPHSLDSDYVRDQLVARTVDLNGKTYNPDGEYVLYWMQSTHRIEENWALRAAVRTANRIRRPLIIHQGLDPTYLHASDRHHTFILEGARETARRAAQAGLHYQFVLRQGRDDDRRVVDRLAARAYVVFTDLFPTAGVRERSERFAARAICRVLAVDGFCSVPSGLFPKAEYAARTIRPKLARLLDHAIEPVDDELPSEAVSPSLRHSLLDTIGVAPLPIERMSDAGIAAAVAACGIDHGVPAVALRGGAAVADARLEQFVAENLPHYVERRNEAGADDGTSRLSPFLHYGHIASARLVRAARSAGATTADVDAFVGQVTTWRELSFNWCVRTRDFDQIESLPDWAQRTMAAHVGDERPVLYDFATMEQGTTHDSVWNTAQRQLLRTGVIHNYPRMIWGKTLLLWTKDYETARATMFTLNDKWALDGRDPNSVGGIMWCLGLWDRPWGNKPVWGGLRPMVTSRARYKFDIKSYMMNHGTQASIAEMRRDGSA